MVITKCLFPSISPRYKFLLKASFTCRWANLIWHYPMSSVYSNMSGSSSWICDFNFVTISWYRYLEDLDEGVFIQQTLESVLLNEDGKQLMVWFFVCHIQFWSKDLRTVSNRIPSKPANNFLLWAGHLSVQGKILAGHKVYLVGQFYIYMHNCCVCCFIINNATKKTPTCTLYIVSNVRHHET